MQTRRLQRFFQRIRGMGIIHNDGRFARRAEHFHTPTDRLQTRCRVQQFLQRITQRQQRCQRQQQVADVKGAHQAALYFALAPAGIKLNGRPAVVIAHRRRLQPAAVAVRVNMIFHRHRDRVRQLRQPTAAHFIVRVDNRLTAVVRGVKQPFCRFVMFHITVIIEMIPAQVSKDRGGKLQRRYAMLHQTVGRDFHGSKRCPLPCEAGKHMLHIDRRASGVFRRNNFIQQTVTDRPHHRAGIAKQFGPLRQQLCRGGLAVSPGDAHQAQLFRRLMVKTPGQRG